LDNYREARTLLYLNTSSGNVILRFSYSAGFFECAPCKKKHEVRSESALATRLSSSPPLKGGITR
jgi:hypothetical protein